MKILRTLMIMLSFFISSLGIRPSFSSSISKKGSNRTSLFNGIDVHNIIVEGNKNLQSIRKEQKVIEFGR